MDLSKMRRQDVIFYEIIPCLIIFSYTLNLLGRHSIISYLMLAYSVALLFVAKESTVHYTRLGITIAAFGLIYTLAYLIVVGSFDIGLFRHMIICYLFGKAITRKLSSQDVISIIPRYLLAGSFGFSLQAYLTVSNSVMIDSRRFYEYWYGNGSVVAATQIAAWAVLSIGMFFWYFCIFKESKLIEKVLSIAGLVLSLSSFLIASSRTGLIFIAILIVVLVFYAMRRGHGAILGLIAIILLGVAMFYFNWFDVQTKFFGSNLLNRLLYEDKFTGIVSGGRGSRYQLFFHEFLKYPFGGYNIRNTVMNGQIHNVVFDSYDLGGWVLALLLIAILLSPIKKCIKLIKNYDLPKQFTIPMICWIALYVLQMMLEPVLDYGNKTYFAFFVFGVAIVESIYEKIRTDAQY